MSTVPTITIRFPSNIPSMIGHHKLSAIAMATPMDQLWVKHPNLKTGRVAVADADSIGAMRALSEALGRRVGGSTGTNLIACAELIAEMAREGRAGSVVTLLCDGGDRYAQTCYDDAWLEANGVAWRPAAERMAAFLA